MTPRRGRISAQLMEALQMMKFSLRKGRPLKFTKGMSWSEELKEFELIALTTPLGDAEAYGRSLEEDEGDSDDLMDMLDDLDTLAEQLVNELEESGEESEDDDDDDIYQ